MAIAWVLGNSLHSIQLNGKASLFQMEAAMSRGGSVSDNVVEQNGRKRLIQKIAFTTSAGVTTLGTADVYGNPVPDSATLVLQPVGADVYYELRETGATTAITDTTGTRPGTYVQALQQEYTVRYNNSNVKPGADLLIDLKGVGSGTLIVSWVD